MEWDHDYCRLAVNSCPLLETIHSDSMAAQNGAMAAQNGAMAAQNGAMAAQNGAMAAQNGAMAAQNGAMAAQNGAMAAQNGAMAAQIQRIRKRGPSEDETSGSSDAEGSQHHHHSAVKRKCVEDKVGGQPSSKPLKLTRCDYVWLWKKRRCWWLAESKMHTCKMDELRTLIEPLTEDEEEWIRERRQQTLRCFPGLKVSDLEEKLKSLGVPCSGLSKNELVEALKEAQEKNKCKEPALDKYQSAVLKKVHHKKVIVVHAGPGSGKTTTLSALVSDILCRKPLARVLVLSFNQTAKREITSMLKKHHVKFLGKTAALSEKCPPGCLVTTFNFYGFWAVGLPEQTDMMSKDERVSLRQSEALLRLVPVDQAPRRWDLLVVDEAQDLNKTHGQIVQLLTREYTHLVVAGDEYMRQYPGRSWFYRLKKEKTPDKDLIVLPYNYRSSTKIVAALNKFRQKNNAEEEEEGTDGEEENDSISYSKHKEANDDEDDGWDEDDADGDEEADDDLVCKQMPGRKVGGTFKRWQTPSAKHCARKVAHLTHLSSSKDTFAITPVTVNDRNENLTELIQKVPSKMQPKSTNLVASRNCPSAVPLSELNSCVISTPRGVRGAGRKRVVVYGVTQSFAQEGVPRSLLTRLIYVAMSRAKDRLYIITDGPLPPDSPLKCFKFESVKPVREGSLLVPDKSIKARVLAKESYQPQHKMLQAIDPSVKSLCEQRGKLAIKMHRSKKVVGVISGLRRSKKLKLVTSLRRKELLRLARAKMALQYACNLKTHLNYEQLSLPSESPDAAYFAVDIETEGNPRFTDLTEIGAVAFTASGEVLGTYHHVLSGAEPLPEFENEDTKEGYTQTSSSESDEADKRPVFPWLKPRPYRSRGFSRAISFIKNLHSEFEPARQNLPSFPRDSPEGCEYDEESRPNALRRLPLARPFLSSAASYTTHDRRWTETAGNPQTAPQNLPSFPRDRPERSKYDEESRPNALRRLPLARPFLSSAASYTTHGRRGTEEAGSPHNSKMLNLLEVRQVCSAVQAKAATDLQEDPVSKLAGQVEDESFSVEGFTGLRVRDTNKVHKSQAAALTRFHRWVGRISKQPCFVHWTGTAETALQLKASFDVGLLFRTWLATEDQKRRPGMKLQDSVRQVLGPQFPYEPNRAFEDAVATASVFLALTQNEGH